MSNTFDAPQSRNEAILQNMLGANNELEEPQSRIEELLQELLELLSQGGGNVTADAVASAIGDMTSAQAAQAVSDLGAEPEKLVVTVTESGGPYSADKTFAEIDAAYRAGKPIVARLITGEEFTLTCASDDGTTFCFGMFEAGAEKLQAFTITIQDDESVDFYNLTVSEDRHTSVVNGATAAITPANRTDYRCVALALTSLTITNPPAIGSYSIVFTSGSTATTTTIPSTILGLENFAAEANTMYEINVLDNRAVVGSWAVSAGE